MNVRDLLRDTVKARDFNQMVTARIVTRDEQGVVRRVKYVPLSLIGTFDDAFCLNVEQADIDRAE